MKLLRAIKAARRQPRHVRDNIAFGVAAAFTAVVVAVWIYLPGSTSNQLGSGGEVAGTESQPFFAQIRDSFSQQAATIKESFQSISPQPEPATVSATGSTVAASTTFRLTEENRRFMGSSTEPAASTTTADAAEGRRIVLIATTSASSTEQP